MDEVDHFQSPTGRFSLDMHCREVFNTHWVRAPVIRDEQSGVTLLDLAGSQWSIEAYDWTSETTLRFEMRKYPGNHQPGVLNITLDCIERRASIDGGATMSLTDLLPVMEKSLTWIYAKAPEPAPGLLVRLRRFLGLE